MLTNMQSARRRIESAKTVADLERAEVGFCRVYDAGQLTAPELDRLFDLTLQKMVRLSEVPGDEMGVKVCSKCGETAIVGLVTNDHALAVQGYDLWLRCYNTECEDSAYTGYDTQRGQ